MDDDKAAPEPIETSEHGAEHDATSKKSRKRMKELRKKILAQMEFYFSDSNLQKDRFLHKEIQKSKDSYINIELFLTFNKIRALTDDPKVIARSLKKSSLLEVNNDETKIRRSVPLQELPDVDERTVYVEPLPRNTDHEWVRSLFSPCGRVLYVSLPRFRTTNDLKGFGFVEFGSAEEAARACEMLNNPPPMSGRTGRFPKWNKMLCQLAKKTGEEPNTDIENQEKPKETVEEPIQKPCKKHKKRRRRTSESSLDGSSDPLPQKKRKLDSTDGTEENDGKESQKDCGKDQASKEQGKLDESVSDGLKSEEEDRKEGKRKKRKKQRLSDSNKSFEEDSETADSSGVEKGERGKRKRTSDSRESGEFSAPQAKVSKTDVQKSQNTTSGKKKRKRKKKNKEKDVPPPQLKVITKREWLTLREEYLSKQKANMAAMKQSLKQHQEEKEAEANKMNKEGKKNGGRPAIEFIPSVIVNVHCENPMTRKSLKDKLPNDAKVAYFDIKDDSTSGHIRCQDEESAKKISDILLENYTFSLLTGDNEKQYWDKLTLDREQKYNNNTRQKKRGSQKLIEKAHRHNTEVMEKKKHIVFED